MSIGAPWGSGEHIDGTPFRVVVAGSETNGHAVVITVDMPLALVHRIGKIRKFKPRELWQARQFTEM